MRNFERQVRAGEIVTSSDDLLAYAHAAFSAAEVGINTGFSKLRRAPSPDDGIRNEALRYGGWALAEVRAAIYNGFAGGV